MCNALAVAEERASGEFPNRGARRRARTRAQLLGGARTLFARQGVEATTIQQITEEADIGFGSFYNHFSSKDEIIEVVLGESLAAHGQLIDEITRALEDPAEVFSAAHRYFVNQAESDPELGWLIVRLEDSHRIMMRALGAQARRDIAAGIASGRFNVSDPEVAFLDTSGALLLVMRAVLDHEVGAGADSHHAENVLRVLGLTPQDAAAVARRPLPEALRSR